MGPLIPTTKWEIIKFLKTAIHDFRIEGESGNVCLLMRFYIKRHLHACSPSTISGSKLILSTAPVSK